MTGEVPCGVGAGDIRFPNLLHADVTLDIEQRDVTLNVKMAVLVLAVSAFLLLLAASLTGILADDGGKPYMFTSLRGEAVEIYGGKGLYQFDSVSKAIVFRGFDWANLFGGLPLLAWGILLHQRGKRKGQLLVASVFTYLAYIYLIGVMGNAFNVLFLVWTALFSVSLFGLALVLAEIDISAFPEELGTNFPRRSLSIYTIALGLFLLLRYLAEILSAYRSGKPPASLGVYATLELAALELGIMVPLHILGGMLLWRRKAVGYLLTILLAFAAFMAFNSLAVAALLTYFLYGGGRVFDVAIPITLAVVAAGFSFVTLGRVKDPETRRVTA